MFDGSSDGEREGEDECAAEGVCLVCEEVAVLECVADRDCVNDDDCLDFVAAAVRDKDSSPVTEKDRERDFAATERLVERVMLCCCDEVALSDVVGPDAVIVLERDGFLDLLIGLDGEGDVVPSLERDSVGLLLENVNVGRSAEGVSLLDPERASWLAEHDSCCVAERVSECLERDVENVLLFCHDSEADLESEDEGSIVGLDETDWLADGDDVIVRSDVGVFVFDSSVVPLSRVVDMDSVKEAEAVDDSDGVQDTLDDKEFVAEVVDVFLTLELSDELRRSAESDALRVSVRELDSNNDEE